MGGEQRQSLLAVVMAATSPMSPNPSGSNCVSYTTNISPVAAIRTVVITAVIVVKPPRRSRRPEITPMAAAMAATAITISGP